MEGVWVVVKGKMLVLAKEMLLAPSLGLVRVYTWAWGDGPEVGS
jgi:hypothetical protein